MENKYYDIKKKYLAESLAFLGFRYYKFGQGKNIVYKFEYTNEFIKALTELMQLKNRVGQFLE